jgi:glycerol-3-phosphate dehydrogenase
LANRFDNNRTDLFRKSLAWNILLDRKPFSDHALAVKSKDPDAPTYFVLPWKGKMLAGTGHAPYGGESDVPVPSEEQLANFLRNLKRALPGLEGTGLDILHVYSGFLPVTEDGGIKLTTREVFIDHGEDGGTKGLYSIAGIKYTTARRVAGKTLKAVFGNEKQCQGRDPRREAYDLLENDKVPTGIYDFNWFPRQDDSSWKEPLKKITAEESVLHLDDLILRRTSLGDNPLRAMDISMEVCGIFQWDEDRCRMEIERLRRSFRSSAGKGRITTP